MPRWRLIVFVLLPFAAAYYVSYVFWLISPLMASSLASELNLSSSDLGMLGSSYFLALIAAQLPIGVLIDRHGPRRVQSVCLMIAAAGGVIFALAGSFPVLMLGRVMIGAGLATILIAGLKSIAVWFPPDKVATANALLVSIGALGAITATVPAGILVDALGWRAVCLGLATATAICAANIFLVVPEIRRSEPHNQDRLTLRAIYADRRFWKLAPLSATCVGTAWAMQGLWAAPWLSEVEAFDRQTVIWHLFVMAVALGVGATLLGMVSDHLRKVGFATKSLFGYIALFSVVAELSILLRWPIPSYLCWALVALMGASGVLSHTMVASYFPKEASARANTALHFLHLGAAFVVQWATGAIVDLWQVREAVHPAQAYQVAFAVNVALQAATMIWFVRPDTKLCRIKAGQEQTLPLQLHAHRTPPIIAPYAAARREWLLQLVEANAHLANWRLAGIGMFTLACVLASRVSSLASERSTFAISQASQRNLETHYLAHLYEVAVITTSVKVGIHIKRANEQQHTQHRLRAQ